MISIQHRFCMHLYKSILIVTSLMSTTVYNWEEVPQRSLWGKDADFTSNCVAWTLQNNVTVPSLNELTVCFSLQLEGSDSPLWKAFTYRHPHMPYTELGLGGKSQRLIVWLFGMEFRTVHITPLEQDVWYDLCITWAEDKGLFPTLYLNGAPQEIQKDHKLPLFCCVFTGSGSLTLGMSHTVDRGLVKPLSVGRLKGKVSQFRMWSQERSQEEVTSLKCTEGDVVKWEQNQWNTATCAPKSNSSLQCVWSCYEVKLRFVIYRSEGKNSTELYTAREIAHRWLERVLSNTVFFPRVSVFEDTLTSRSDINASQMDQRASESNSFRCLVYLSIIPGWDVAAMQFDVHKHLKELYVDDQTGFTLRAHGPSMYITAIDFSSPTMTPSSTSTAFTTPTPETRTSTAFSSLVTSTRATHPPTTPSTATSATASTTAVATITAGTVTQQTTFKTSTLITSVTTGQVTVTDLIPTAVTSSVDTTTTLSSHTTTSPSVSKLYFEVQLNVTLTRVSDPESTITFWLNSSLPDDTMTVLDLQLLSKTIKVYHSFHVRSLMDSISRESCVFQVEVSNLDLKPLEIENLIHSLLKKPFHNGSITIAAEDILISRILDFQCHAETRHTREGLFRWPDTSGGRNATLQCPKSLLHTATRHCKICMQTFWMAADMSSCPLVVEVIPDLNNIQVTTDNVQDVLDMILDLLKNQAHLNYDDLTTVLNKVEDIINVSVMTPPLGQALIDVISDVLESASNLQPFTNMILNITESLGDKITGYDNATILSAPFVGMSVVDVEPGHFRTLSFGVLANRVEVKPEIFINRYPLNGTVAYIALPSVLEHNFPQNNENLMLPRIQFQFFGVPWLFKTKPSNDLVLNTFVVSASVTNASSAIRDLEEDIRINLHHLQPNYNNKDVQCVFWNFNLNDGEGGWDPTGCRKYNSTPHYTTCLCDHLTHFGVLLEVSRTPLDPEDEYKLTIITYVGCGVSSLFLGITVLTYTAFEKLRRDYPSQILINLSLALLGLNLVFLVNSWFSSWGVYGLCVFVATMLHYFLLASFTWMGLEAVNMYLALVKVFNVYVPSYILKFCALGWGIPLVVCVLVLIVDREAYGSQLYTEAQLSLQPLDDSDNFCWIQDNATFYVTVVGYAALVFLFNTAVFIVVLIQIRRMRYNSPAGIHSGLMKDLKGVTSLTLLLGLTWTIAFFTWGPARVAMLFLFSTLNSLQGLFIFVFHCLMKENVRKQWRIHLCFGRFRLEENSEWSASASFGVKPKPPMTQARVPSVRSVKSSSTESTSASSESSQRESISSSKRPDLGLFVTGLVIPRAHCSSSGPALRSHGSLNPTPGWTNHLLTQEHS